MISSIRRPERFRSGYYTFNILNAFSFMLLSGTVPTLLALLMGASGTYIGLLGSLNFLTYFFMPVGRSIIRNRGIVRVFGWSWMFRYWGMAPVLAAPFLVAAGAPVWGLAILMGGSLLFNIFRGIGLIGNNPVLAFMAGPRNRGAFLSNIQISSSLTAIVTSALTALMLSMAGGAPAYVFLMAAGVASGIIGAILLLRMPEPTEYRPPEGSSLAGTIKEAFADKRFRRFVLVFAPLSFTAGTARTFIITHARALYGQSDGLVMLYAVAFNLGIVGMGFLSRTLMDRLGPKPLYAVFAAVAALALVPVALSPQLPGEISTLLFLIAVNFAVGFGIVGQENAGQAYFFSLVKPEHVVDLAVVYYIVFGIGGALGSAAGGVFLDIMSSHGASQLLSYRILYGFITCITVLSTVAVSGLSAPDSATVRESLGVIFSLRDLKSIGLLERLGRTHSPVEEISVIREIGTRGSPVAEKEILPYLSSPRFDVRVEALLALENLDILSHRALKALIDEIGRNPWSTAYIAARILGKRGFQEAIPELRKALDSQDYMLKSSVALALARLDDLPSLPAIEALAASTENPRLMINAAIALETYGRPEAIPILVSILKKKNPPAFAFDEIVLALAGMLGGLDDFYRLYSIWTRDPADGLSALMDSFSGSAANGPDGLRFRQALESFVKEGTDSPLLARAIIEMGAMDGGAATVLSEAALDPDLIGHAGFRFLIAACAIAAVKPR